MKPEAPEKCKHAIKEFVDYIRASEPQTLQYLTMLEADDARRSLHVFIFADPAARDRHANSDAVKRFTDALYPNCVAPVEFTEHTVIGAK